MAKADTLGFSSGRLERITAAFEAAVAAERLAGAIVVIERAGETVYRRAIGYRDTGRSAAMPDDAIFRLYSMTKPVVSVAAMSLVEEGRILLDDPVSAFIPGFKSAEVGRPVRGADGKTTLALEPLRREITVQDLLRHTSGLIYAALIETSAVGQRYIEAGINDADRSLAEWTETLAGLPLAHQPGEAFDYSHSTDVLGRVIEIACGRALDEAVAERVTGPLGMADTGFSVPEPDWGRIAEAVPDKATGRLPPLREARHRPVLLSGGGGMVGTAEDYLRFTRMLLGGGALGATRILAPKSVALMAADHLGAIPRDTASGRVLLGPGYGFGLGFATRLALGEAATLGSIGEFYWGGWAGTHFWIDPRERLAALMMIQQPNERAYFSRLYRNLVYQALIG